MNTAETPMNVLMVLADQHNAGWMGCAGHPQALTPHLDAFAATGARFTNAYAQNPICTPSRVSILTGQYCHNHGYYGFSGPSAPAPGSLFRHFRAHGYRTAAYGKLRLRPDSPTKKLGFEEFPLDGFGCDLEPGQKLSDGKWNATGYRLLLPGVNNAERICSPAFWTRDPAWMADAGLVSFADVWGWTVLMCATMNGEAARPLPTGATIPPFAIPDHINLDGTPVYFPGTYDSGDSQGGECWGLLPPHDDQYWLTFTAYAAMRLSKNAALGARRVETPLGRMPVWQACHLAHHAMEVDPETGCCLIREGRHQVDWGYCDSLRKTGLALFPSLLRLESCEKLAALCKGCGQVGVAAALRAQAAHLRSSLARVFIEHRNGEAWLVSATGNGRLPDIWGTAFAVHRGFVEEDLAAELSQSLLSSYRHGSTVLDGQVAHLDHRYGAHWPNAGSPGHYQNGAYWGYPLGWYVSALARIDQPAARELFLEYFHAMQKGWNSDGSGCGFECINPALDHWQNQGYMTTLALPYVALFEVGLLERE